MSGKVSIVDWQPRICSEVSGREAKAASKTQALREEKRGGALMHGGRTFASGNQAAAFYAVSCWFFRERPRCGVEFGFRCGGMFCIGALFKQHAANLQSEMIINTLRAFIWGFACLRGFFYVTDESENHPCLIITRVIRYSLPPYIYIVLVESFSTIYYLCNRKSRPEACNIIAVSSFWADTESCSTNPSRGCIRYCRHQTTMKPGL